jgi:hypothetical protein
MPMLTVASPELHSCRQISIQHGVIFQVKSISVYIRILCIAIEHCEIEKQRPPLIEVPHSLQFDFARKCPSFCRDHHRHVASVQRQSPVNHNLPAAAAGFQSLLRYRIRTKLLVAHTILGFLVVPVVQGRVEVFHYTTTLGACWRQVAYQRDRLEEVAGSSGFVDAAVAIEDWEAAYTVLLRLLVIAGAQFDYNGFEAGIVACRHIGNEGVSSDGAELIGDFDNT